MLTHLYRNFLVKNQWINLSTERLMLNVFIASFVFSFCYALVYYLLSFFFYFEIIEQLKMQHVFGAFISIFILFGIWNAIYFAWNYIENNRQILIKKLQTEALMKDLEIKKFEKFQTQKSSFGQ